MISRFFVAQFGKTDDLNRRTTESIRLTKGTFYKPTSLLADYFIRRLWSVLQSTASWTSFEERGATIPRLIDYNWRIRTIQDCCPFSRGNGSRLQLFRSRIFLLSSTATLETTGFRKPRGFARGDLLYQHAYRPRVSSHDD